ncbi:MAG: biotin attachment protein, partial [Bdellovibrionales bacterium]|nr:biotin attachment protein [Bdellovibrionales bacterium]
MIFTEKKKIIRVMLTTFRDGLQSSFGGKVRLADFLPAMEVAAKEVGARHLEFGGGARYQAPLFYLNENPFDTMNTIRQTVGEGVDLQILTRSVSGVTLTTQNISSLQLQAKLMAKYGTTWDRNFDYMNDVRNLVKTGRPIVEAGMHHQVCIALMGLPFHSDKVHTAEFYLDIGRQILKSDVQVDSICLKDASGTTDPKTIYDLCVALKKEMPANMPLWIHTHDTASMAISCYMAAIAGGADGVDLSIRPMASGTVQPDVRSMAHALKGTGYELDLDVSKVHILEEMLTKSMVEYDFNPVTTSADARVIGFPMPGGAIGPNVHMMVKAGLLDRYSDILAEFPVVVEAGGAWSSVTPGSQQYWLQAFNNVLLGRWKKIDAGYGKSVLGYFGKTPLAPDPAVVKIAAEQLEMPPFDGDPLEAAPNAINGANEALKDSGLPITDENTFLVVSSMVGNKKMQLNEGLRFLKGKGKVDLPLKKSKKEGVAVAAATSTSTPLTGPVVTTCQVEEGGKTRSFKVTVAPLGSTVAAKSSAG